MKNTRLPHLIYPAMPAKLTRLRASTGTEHRQEVARSVRMRRLTWCRDAHLCIWCLHRACWQGKEECYDYWHQAGMGPRKGSVYLEAGMAEGDGGCYGWPAARVSS